MRRAEPIAGLGGLALLVAAVLDFGVLHAFLLLYALLAIAVPLILLLLALTAYPFGVMDRIS